MEIFITCLLFLVGLALIVKGGDTFVDAASWIAKAMHIPTFIIGATIVSVATTLPEIIVSCMAAAEGKTEMAIGNGVGSVIANTAMILAVAVIAMKITTDRKKYWKPVLLLIAASAVLLVGSLTGKLLIPASVILFIIFALFMVQNIISAKSEPAEDEERKPVERKDLVKNIILFVVGAAAIVVGSRLMVSTGSKIALWLGVPERIVAVTLIAVGTSLPELVTTITAIVKKEAALSIGNIIGANVIDLSLILPLCSVISRSALPVSAQSIALDLPVCLLVTLVATVPLLIWQKSRKWQGVLLLLMYVGYLVLVVR